MIRARYDVWCDAEGCTLWEHAGPSRSKAPDVAKRAGWTTRSVRTPDGYRQRWLCPHHSKESVVKMEGGDVVSERVR